MNKQFLKAVILISILWVSKCTFAQDSSRFKNPDLKKTPGVGALDTMKPIKEHRSIGKDLVNDIVISWQDTKALITLPFHLSPGGWLWTTAIAGASVGIMAADKKMKNAIGRNTDQTFNHDFWDGPTYYGFVQYPAIAAGAMYLTGLFVRNDWTRVTARLWLESLGYSGVSVITLRYITGRYRPYYSDNQWKFTWFQPKNDTQSFPSGHTVVAFATSTVLAERIGTWWSRIIFYSAACLTGYGRLLNNQHWFSDVVLGGAMGFGMAWMIVHRQEGREQDEEYRHKRGMKGGDYGEKKLSLYPWVNGVGLVWRF